MTKFVADSRGVFDYGVLGKRPGLLNVNVDVKLCSFTI